MRRALQSWSPRTKPLSYDSLTEDTGCQSLAVGNAYFGSNPFVRICVLEHEGGNTVFNQQDQVSYTLGPTVIGTVNPLPWATPWAAWVGNSGVRYGKFSHIDLPSNTLGESLGIYPASKPDKISLGFMSTAFPALAIQKDPGTIELSWYNDDADGGSISISDPALTISLIGGANPQFSFTVYGKYFNSSTGINNVSETVTVFADAERTQQLATSLIQLGSHSAQLTIPINGIDVPVLITGFPFATFPVNFTINRGYQPIASIGTKRFSGFTFVLQNNNAFFQGKDVSDSGLVIYFIREQDPRKLLAAFEQDPDGEFANIFVINVDIPTDIVNLLHSEPIGKQQVIYGRDDEGRDVTIYSQVYDLVLTGDKASLRTSLVFGVYRQPVVPLALALDRAKLSLFLPRATYSSVVQSPSPNPIELSKATLDLSIYSGEYT